MENHQRIIVIGASSGGNTALKTIFAGLPPDLSACVLVVLHIGSYESILPAMLQPSTRLPLRFAEDGELLEAGTILFAPPDHHLLVVGNRARLAHTAKENHSRPAIDPLFRSAALAFKNRAVGVVLTGHLDDGTIGLQAIKAHGGTAIVQDATEAEAPSMPLSASRYVDIDFSLPLSGIASVLVNLVAQAPSLERHPYDERRMMMENDFALTGDSSAQKLDKIGTRSVQTCPDCGGVLWEMNSGAPPRFRCHTGHAFTAVTLLEEQTKLSEEALWAAIRALHEKQTLLQRLAAEAEQRQTKEIADEYRAAAQAASRHAEALRGMVRET